MVSVDFVNNVSFVLFSKFFCSIIQQGDELPLMWGTGVVSPGKGPEKARSLWNNLASMAGGIVSKVGLV